MLALELYSVFLCTEVIGRRMVARCREGPHVHIGSTASSLPRRSTSHASFGAMRSVAGVNSEGGSGRISRWPIERKLQSRSSALNLHGLRAVDSGQRATWALCALGVSARPARRSTTMCVMGGAKRARARSTTRRSSHVERSAGWVEISR
jgi:hypothetical protein